MSESLITKKALGEAMKRLMVEQPFEKISVRDMTDQTGRELTLKELIEMFG